MALGKKQKRNTSFKPTINYVHPSLRSSPSQPSSLTPAQDGSASVSDKIQYLRKVQRPSPSSVAEVEQDLSTLQIRTPPRGHVPGPPPPRSWISGEAPGLATARNSKSIMRPGRLDYLPGTEMPGGRSLTHLLLKDMAHNAHWHLAYDHIYLSALPVGLKGKLMSYIACYGPSDGKLAMLPSPGSGPRRGSSKTRCCSCCLHDRHRLNSLSYSTDCCDARYFVVRSKDYFRVT